MTLGKRLMQMTHRGRWALFSSLVEIPENLQKRLPAPPKDESKEDPENAIFENDFFRNARKLTPSL